MPTADHVDPPFLPKREAVVETLPRRASVPGRALRVVLAGRVGSAVGYGLTAALSFLQAIRRCRRNAVSDSAVAGVVLTHCQWSAFVAAGFRPCLDSVRADAGSSDGQAPQRIDGQRNAGSVSSGVVGVEPGSHGVLSSSIPIVWAYSRGGATTAEKSRVRRL